MNETVSKGKFNPDVVHDAEFACKDMGETAAEMVLYQFSEKETKRFLSIYSKALKQLIKKGLWNVRPHQECPQPDVFMSEGLPLSEEATTLLGSVQETVDSYFDEALFVSLGEGDSGAPYTNTHFPFAPYNRYWFNFYLALKELI